MADSTSTAPTADQIAAAQAVISAATLAAAQAEVARIKPVTDFVASDAAKQTRATLEALLATFQLDPVYGVHLSCALTGLRGLGVTTASAS